MNRDSLDSRVPWKTAWVTGAGRGIGAELTRLLCRQGVTVYGSARSSEELEQLRQELSHCDGELIPVVLDIRDSHAVQQLFHDWDDVGIMPELVVLNAGSHDPFSVYEFSSQRCKELLEINLQGTINCLDPVLYRYLKRDGATERQKQTEPSAPGGLSGQIAVVSSSAGYRGLPVAAAYGAGKAALINLCESLRLDLRGSGIRLQLINPGFVRTPLTDKNDFPMPALMEPDEAARRIVKGLLSDRFEIIFPRHFVYLLKLFRVMPYRWYFWLVGRVTGAGRDVRNN